MTQTPTARQFLEVVIVRNAQDGRHEKLERNKTYNNASEDPVERGAPWHVRHDGHSNISPLLDRTARLGWAAGSEKGMGCRDSLVSLWPGLHCVYSIRFDSLI